MAEVMDVQARLFATRRAALQRESTTLKESAEALKIQLDGMRDLAKEGYLPRNRMLDAEREQWASVIKAAGVSTAKN